MQVLRHPPAPSSSRPVLALGNFDGVHLGHKAVLAQARSVAQQLRAPFGVMTFHPHPRMFFNPSAAPQLLVPLHQKLRLLQECGVERVYLQRFNRPFSELSAERFVEEILVRQARAAHIVTGEDFVFGHKRSGHADLLRAYAEKGAFGYTALTPQGEGGQVFSSSLIRSYLHAGEVEKAAHMLGRPYEWVGTVVHGDQRGRTLGFPTANMFPASCITTPHRGVYAVKYAPLAGGAWVNAVANLGIRPTFGADRLRLEVHALEGSPDLYGARLRVQFMRFIRPEQSFASVDALKAQIATDCQTAREIHAV